MTQGILSTRSPHDIQEKQGDIELLMREHLPEHITYVEHPIEVGNGDWAIGLIGKRSILYSRYPFPGADGKRKQRIFRWRGRFDDNWNRFISSVAKWALREIPHEAAVLVAYLNRLRMRWTK